MEDPVVIDEAQWFHYKRKEPKERVYVSDCLSKTHNRGTVPGLLPPVPDGRVDYSVWVEWRRNGAGWSRMLYAITVGVDLLVESR